MKYVHEPHRIFACDPDGQLLAEITFPFSSLGVVNINHTYVHPDLRGQQIADALIRLALADIRAQGWRYTPTCTFAAQWLTRHPDEA